MSGLKSHQRKIINGYLNSGVARDAEDFIDAVGLAVGIGAVLAISRVLAPL